MQHPDAAFGTRRGTRCARPDDRRRDDGDSPSRSQRARSEVGRRPQNLRGSLLMAAQPDVTTVAATAPAESVTSAEAAPAAASAQPWPSKRTAFKTLFVLTVVVMFTVRDRQVLALIIERGKARLG